ncbi:hypothetical protein [Streptomyces adustus]
MSVIVASVGVFGTLASAGMTQFLAQRAESRRSELEMQLRVTEQQAAEDQRKLDQLRHCYVQLNANDRHYRDAMLAYAYALKSGTADVEAAEVSAARRSQRDTRAEAQIVASDAVLRAESRVNEQLTTAYRYLMEAEGESDPSARQTRLQRIIALLGAIIEQQERVRALMRREVRDTPALPEQHHPAIDSSAHRHASL